MTDLTPAAQALLDWATRESSVGNFVAGQFSEIARAIPAIAAEARATAEALYKEWRFTGRDAEYIEAMDRLLAAPPTEPVE